MIYELQINHVNLQTFMVFLLTTKENFDQQCSLANFTGQQTSQYMYNLQGE